MLNNGNGESHVRGKKRPYEDIATAKVITKLRKHDNNKQETPGVIKKIKLENFMSHEEFTWEPLSTATVHFVTGKNGSGKSSVLQGIVLGLMGEVKHIGRYSKPKDFIRKDCSRAIINVTLSNIGDDAFKPEEYGDEITIQRTITESAGSYVIKGTKQRDVSAPKKQQKEVKEEIKRMLNKFQIQVDSPIVILHQETAKEMLKIESSSSLYSFFEKATLIKQCQDEFNDACKELARAKTNWKNKQKQYKDMLVKYQDLKLKHQKKLELIQNEKEVQKLKEQYISALVFENREEAEKKEAEIDKHEKSLQDSNEKFKKLQEESEKLHAQSSELLVKIEDEKSKFHQQEEEIDQLKEEIEKLRGLKREIDATLKTDSTKSNHLVREMGVLRDQIKQLEKSTKFEDKEQKALTKQYKLDRLNQDKSKVDEDMIREGKARDAQDAKIRDEREKMKNLSKLKMETEATVFSYQQELNAMQQNTTQHNLIVYGTKIPALDREIKNMESEFHKLPIGPVGAYVKLDGEAATNPDLGRLIETELTKAQLTSYLTTDDHDRRKLQSVMDRIFTNDKGRKPRIFTSRFLGRRHTVSRPFPDNNPVVMDYLKFENNDVFNHLVDQKQIENVLVCNTQDEAKSLMSIARNVPDNVNYTITQDFNRFFPAKKNSSYRSYYIESFPGNGLLKGTMTSVVQELSDNLKRSKDELNRITNEFQSSELSKKSFEAEKQRALNDIQILRKNMQKITSEISKVKSSEEENDTADLESFRLKLSNKEADHEAMKFAIKKKTNEKTDISEKLKSKESTLASARTQLNASRDNEAHDKLTKDHNKIKQQVTNKAKEIKNRERLIGVLESKISNAKGSLKDLQELEKTYRNKTSGTVGEKRPTKTSKELNAKYQNLMQKITGKEEGSEDEKNLATDFLDATQKLEKYKADIEELERNIRLFDGMKQERNTKMQMIRDMIIDLVRRKFNEMIKRFSTNLGCEVFMRIDQRKKRLTFIFKSKDNVERTNTEVSSLSGGEKSYTQMCLICSLWEMMEPPFRCLDEWDVFLDAINRKEISKELLNFGLKNPNKQFIFISPQGACDLSSVPHGKVEVLEIKK